MDDHIRSKFPALQRSRTTVSSSGIPGSVAPLLHPTQPNVPGLRLIQIHLLYEDGSEISKGSFTPGKSDFLVRFPPAHQNLAVDTEDLRPAHRPSAPALKDQDARSIRLPRKTVVPKKVKRKRVVKGRKLTDQKRPRRDPPGRERQYNPPRRRRAPLKSVTAAQSNRGSWLPPTRERQPHVPKVQQRARRVSLKSTRFAAMSAPSTNRHESPGEDIQPLHSPPGPEHRHSSGKNTGLVFQRGWKTLFGRPLSSVRSPTPQPPNRNDAPALEEIAYGIARLDPLLARYSARSTPLFLSRNLRDGWTEKVRVWDKDGTSIQERRTPGPDQLAAREEKFKLFVAEALRRAPTAMSDVTKAPLPRTFCLKLRGFDLGQLAKVNLPSSAQIAATLYIRNASSDPIVLYLGSFAIGIPQSTANFFPTPYRIPPSGNLDTIYDGPRKMAPLFVRTSGRDEEHNLSLRALAHPGDIAYIDLLLYDFVDESMDLQNITLTWSAVHATQVYARVEIAGPNAGPNGFSTATQRVPLVWLRDESPGGSRDKPGVRVEHQPQAFLNVEVEWGVDSAAPFLRPRIPKPVPRDASTPSKNLKLVYRLSLQGGDHVLEVEKPTWACVLCSICASFPTQHILKVHLRRAHPQVETKFNTKRQARQDRFEIRVILPPEAIELSDDEEEAPVTQIVAPSTRIGALLAASDAG
ncbi:hypothetical protein FRC08_003196 [Ceratobasidium sp. 394]|nr:hypothetical protein FRC08_003196 [Ceratobasidium sp. 394]